ncbi:hypothetical protein GGI43DRAFT_384204 [Trichoderma evansii]
MIQEGRKPKKQEIDDDEEESHDEWGSYLETIANNEEPVNREDMTRNEDFTLGGFHFSLDSVGGAIAVAEKDGQIVGMKFYTDRDDLDEETLHVFDSQPGTIIF